MGTLLVAMHVSIGMFSAAYMVSDECNCASVCAVACLCICACEQQSEKCSGDTIYSCFLQLVENCQAYLLLCAAGLQCLLLSTAL